MKTIFNYVWYRAMVGIGCAAIVISGCASTPAPTAQMAISTAAVADATNAGAVELAPQEMKVARDKLHLANLALAENNNHRALKLAEQAEADANLAEVKARTSRAEKTASAADESNRILIEELNRKRQ